MGQVNGKQNCVSIVEDEQSLRELWRRLLEMEGLQVQLFTRASEFLENYQYGDSNCLIFDFRLPDGDGVSLLREARRRGWRTPAIIVTGYGDVSSAVDAMKLGALEYIQKPFAPEFLLEKVHEAIKLDHDRRNEADNLTAACERFAELSPRELELVQMVVEGNLSKQIARKLCISPKTVQNHRAHIMAKVKATNIAELVRLAVMAGVAKNGSTPPHSADS